MNRAQKTRNYGLGMAALLVSLTATACYDGAEDGDGDCVSTEDFFRETVYAPILANDCMNCHTSAGAAKDTSFILRTPESGPDYLDANLEAFTQMSKLQFEGQSWILLKPTVGIEHEGGERFNTRSDQYAAFVDMIARIENPSACESGDPTDEYFDGVELLGKNRPRVSSRRAHDVGNFVTLFFVDRFGHVVST